MADVYAVAGAKFYIGGTMTVPNSDVAVSDFDSQSSNWTEVDGWETCGAFGDTAQTITTSLINRARDSKVKGTRNAGQMQNQIVVNTGDAGQQALKAAEKTNDNYAFKLVWDDRPSGGSNPTTHYFIGLVMSNVFQGGGANTADMIQSTVEINSNIAETAAS